MFEHSLSGNCKYGRKCSKSLCSFQHDDQFDNTGDSETHNSDAHADESVMMTDDEQNFDLYVEHNFEEIYEKFINNRKQLNCYYCDYVSKSKVMMNIQGELQKHIEINHSEIIEEYDPDTFDFDNDYHQDFLAFFVQ